MGKQVIVSISREFGSGGHEIALKIAKDLNLKFYDRSILDEIAEKLNVQTEVLEKYDEKPRNVMLSRNVKNYTNSMEEILAELQFEFIRKKAEEGESFVIVGRCSEYVLRGTEDLISVFVTGRQEQKIERIMKKYQLDKTEALIKIKRHDRKRRQYHNRHSDTKWGDSKCYDLCINSSPLGIAGTVKILEAYIQERMQKQEGCAVLVYHD